VRAFDEGGQESKMSNIQSVVPEATYSASQLRGDDSGYFPGLCGTSPAAGFGALVLAALAVTRRRAAPLLGLGVAAVLSVPAAEAKDTETPRALNVQLRYGPTTIADEYVKQVYTNPNQILWFEYGYASQFFDADFGIGLYQELGYLQSADGVPSDEHDMFTMVPLTLTATGRLDFLHEQPIVPFGRIGVDYWMWKENWYVPDEKTMEYRRDGGKYGWHFGGGLMILLDTFDRQAASKLESSAGIDDTYLVAEYRQTLLVHGDQQLNLSSHEITFGLKFDF
jgi:MYXO-CTERM domain-containing protein